MGGSRRWCQPRWPALRGADLRYAAVNDRIARHEWGATGKPEITLHGQPLDESKPTLLWDGEWEVTYVTFRDMGAAFGVAILGIYLLVVAQFGSSPAARRADPHSAHPDRHRHWAQALHAPFTATSMIGFIALAGIIVRNSILLVDFIRHRAQGALAARGAAGGRRHPLQADPAHRALRHDRRGGHPDRPDFPGPRASLLFGLASSTLLTVLVIPAIYVVLRDDGRPIRPPK